MAAKKKNTGRKSPARNSNRNKKRSTKTVVCAEEDRYAPVKQAMWMVAGGLGGAALGGLLVRNGVSTTTAGLAIAAGGAGAALGTQGALRAVGGGAAAAAGGQLMLAWMTKRATENKKKQLAGQGKKTPPNLEQGYAHVEDAFERARQQVAHDYDELEREAA